LHHWQIESAEKLRGAFAEGVKLSLCLWAGKGANCGTVCILIGVQIKGAAIGPPMTGQDRLRDQGDMILEPLSGLPEQIVKHVTHGQHGRACIHRPRHGRQGAHLAADCGMTFQHKDLTVSFSCETRQAQRGGKPGNAGTDDHDPGGGVRTLWAHLDNLVCELLTRRGKLSSMIYTLMSENSDNLGERATGMGLHSRIDAAVSRAIAIGQGGVAPAQLSAALDYATSPGGARIRPTILMSVAMACGDDKPALSDAAAAALELIHCASLVHDDLPCFDDADMRRGKPSVHRAFSQPLAVLTGDSLIVLAFEVLAREAYHHPMRCAELVLTLARRTGMPNGICAGQGWESEPQIDLSAYHQSKTGALFIAATQMGAVAAGQEAEPWFELGARIGEAFQVADDLRDTLYDAETLGKPVGQDDLHGRPNAVSALGVDGAIRRLKDILGGAIASIPSCPGEAQLAEMVRKQAERLTPVAPARSAR